MAFKLRFLRRFESNFESAIDYYNNISSRNAERLVTDVKETINSIANNPWHFGRINSKRRKLNLKTYPYKIIYEIGKEEIVFVALVHHKRHPKYWRTRNN